MTRSFNSTGQAIYKARAVSEVAWLLAKAYGAELDFANHIEGLQRIATYMTDGKWVLAKIAAVQLRFPELPDNVAVRKVISAEDYLAKCRCRTASNKKTRKRDVSDEPRIPAGETGGGQWAAEGGAAASRSNPLLIPAQAIAPPIPVPVPFEFPMPPTGITPPLPLEIPGGKGSQRPSILIQISPNVLKNGLTRWRFVPTNRKS